MVVVVAGLALPHIVSLVADVAYHFSSFSDEGLVSADAKDLARTVVAAHLSRELDEGRNVVWCATLQLAWNEVCSLAGGSVTLAEPALLADRLNAQDVGRGDVDDASCVALAGRIDEGIYDKIDAELERKFKGAATPKLARSAELGRPQDIFAYAYLFRDLRFAKPFEVLPEPLPFGDARVRCFGIDEGKEPPYDLLDQVRIHKYDEATGSVVVELRTKAEDEQLLLAMVPRGRSLKETVDAVLAQLSDTEVWPAPASTVLKIPKFNFHLRRSYDELTGKALVVTSPRMPADSVILAALQDIRFQLDEKGARMRSESHISIGYAAKGPPRHLVFDRPFLLMMKLRSADVPYFAMWVDNAELMVKAE